MKPKSLFHLSFQKPASLLSILIWLTIIAIAGQISFFAIHYKVSDLLDSLVTSSLRSEIYNMVILLPIIEFLLIQIISYSLLIAWIWFHTISISQLFKLSTRSTFWLGLLIWIVNLTAILSINNYLYPDSFFATLLPTHDFILLVFVCSITITTALSYFNFFKQHTYKKLGFLFLFLGALFAVFSFYDYYHARAAFHTENKSSQPNIIFIGLDSLRPDFIKYLGNSTIVTPHIDEFLKKATIFTDTYTPLARTFPAWMSILTAQYPKHSHARTNLADPNSILTHETLAIRLKQIGYETIYGTDEKRFSNITERYGFDYLIGPHMGINDFILGGLNDFPLTNLIINTSIGRVLFPFNYANRAAAITYEPNRFLQLVKLSLAHRSHKPLFLAVHLCITHWPYTWAQDKQANNLTQAQRYQSSVEAVDAQLGELMQILKNNGLLEHSLIVLLSDHGTTMGLLGDRIISEKNYSGNLKKIRWLDVYKLGSAPQFSADFKKDYSISTSYGQGTDVLSLKQYHVLLAFKGFGINTQPNQIPGRTSLLDITPTILEFLNLTPLQESDGISLASYLLNRPHLPLVSRALFLETGHSLSDIQNKDIVVEDVVKHAIGAYQINPTTGQLYVKASAERSVNRSRQRAVLIDDWLLAYYPAVSRTKLILNPDAKQALNFQNYILPAFFVIANIKTGKWSIGLDSAVAKKAPMKALLEKLNGFYGDEIQI